MDDLTTEEMNKEMDGETPPTATPGEGEPGQEPEPLEEEAPKSENDDKPTDDKSGELEDNPRAGKEGTPKGVQKRIDRAVKKQGAAESDRDYQKGRADALEEELAKVKTVSKPKPVIDDFEDIDEFTDALADWKVEEKETKKERELADVKVDPKLDPEREEQRERFSDGVDDAREKYEDYDNVALTDDFPCTTDMTDAILSSENGAELLYQLGKNPKEARRISKLSKTAQAREIGRLEGKLGSQKIKTKKPSGAPEPIEPIGGGGAPSESNYDKMSTDQFMKKRNAGG